MEWLVVAYLWAGLTVAVVASYSGGSWGQLFAFFVGWPVALPALMIGALLSEIRRRQAG